MHSTQARAHTNTRRPMPNGKKKTGHEMVLQSIAHDGRDITLKLLHEDREVRGKLIASDSYTLSVEIGPGEVEVFFKHALLSFSARKRPQALTTREAVAALDLAQ